MALSARELLLIVRAQNQASGALRRVARDVRGLPDMQSLRQRRDQQAINIETLRRGRQQTLNELQSIQNGRRRIANERQILSAQLAQARNASAISRHDRQRFDTSTRMLNQQRIMQNIGNEIARTEALRARAMGRTPAQQARFFQRAAEDPLSRAAVIENRLRNLNQAAEINRRITTSTGMSQDDFIQQGRTLRDNAEQLRMRSLQAAAAEGELNARAGVLNHTLGIQADRIALAEQKFRGYQNEIRSARWDRVSAGGQVLQHFGRVAQYAALIAGGAFAYAANSAAQFATKSTLAATQVANRVGAGAQGVATATTQISRNLLQLLQQSQSTADEINASAYDIFSSMTLRGNQREQINQGVQILKVFNRAAIGGQADISAVTRAGITILNNFAQQGRQVQQVTPLMQRMFAAVRFGRMTVTEFVGTLNQLAPAFSAAFGRSPQTFDQLTGALAALSRQMPSLRMASTGLARLTEMFARRDFVRGLRTFGISITDSHGRLIPFIQILDRLNQRFPRLRQGGQFLQNFFKNITAAGSESGTGGTMGTIQGRRALQLLILNLGQFHTVQNQVITDNNEFTKSFRALRATPAVQWRIFVNTLHSLAITIGMEAIPAITSLARPLVRATHWFNNLDQGTKRQIARWGVYSVAILAVGSAISFVLGLFIRIYAVFGRNLGVFRSTTLAFIAITAAVGVLTEGWRSLSDIVNGFIRMGTGSWGAWLVTIALITTAVIRLRRAFLTLAVAREAAIGTAAVGGVAGVMRTGRNVGTGVALTASAIRTEGAVAGIASGLSLIPPAFIAITAAVGLTALGTYLWKRRLDEAAAVQERIKQRQREIRDLAQAPITFANMLGGLPTSVESIERGRLAIRGIRREIADTRKELRGTTGRRRNELLDQLRGQELDLADAINSVAGSNRRANREFVSLTRSLGALGRNARAISDLQQRLKVLRAIQTQLGGVQNIGQIGELLPANLQRLARQQGVFGASSDQLKRDIDATVGSLNLLGDGVNRTTNTLQSRFRTIINQFSLMKLIPRTVPRRFIDDMFKVATQRGRMLTLPEIRAFIKAEVDPASLRKVPRDIQRVINQSRRSRQFNLRFGNVMDAMTGILGRPAVQNRQANRVALIFQNVVRQAQLGKVNRQAVQVGAQVIQGMIVGIENNKSRVSDEVLKVADAAVQSARRRLGIRSPSTVFQQIGADTIAGLARGIRNGTPLVRRLAQNLAIALIPTNLKRNQQITGALLQRQLVGQLGQLRRFNRDIATLQRAGAPQGLLEQLAQGGLANLNVLNQLVRMSPTQLSRYVNTWKQAMAQISSSTSQTSQDMQQNMKQAVDNMTQMYDQMRQANVEAFGDITQGVRTQNVMQFGGIPGAGDLIPDIRDQVHNFERWRGELNRARRRLPAGLVAQLQQAGPQAEPVLRGLLRLAPRQIRAYVSLWRRAQQDINRATRIDFNVQLRQWRSHGRRAALLFMQGMADEHSFINRQMRRIFLSWLKGNTGANLNTSRGAHTTHNDNRVVIHNPKEDTSTTVRKANFKQRQKHKRRR